MAKHDDIPKTDSTEIEALIKPLKQSYIEPRDRVALVLSYFVLSFVVLSIAYPIWHRLEDMSHLKSYVLAAYLLMSAIVTVVSVLFTPALAVGMKTSPLWVRVSFQAVLDFTLLSLLAMYLGPFRGPLPYISDLVRGPFFSEWYFLTFIFFASPILSLLSAIYYRLVEKSRQRLSE